MPTFWFVSVPAHGDKHATWHNLRRCIGANDNASDPAEIWSFSLPDFKIGTLDALVLVSDELVRQDQVAEAAVMKLVDALKNLSGSDIDVSSQLTVKGKSLEHYIKSFEWSAAKYRSDRPVREIADRLTEDITNMESATRVKISSWSQTKGAAQALQRKQGGNLSVRDLAGVVRKENCLLGSEYLRTVFVAVPKNLYKDFLASYETITPMVVPRSAEKVAEDAEYGLFGVTIFQRALADFTSRCREERFTVRDFVWDEEQMEKDRAALVETASARETMQLQLTEWVKASFGDAFTAWIHLKALRVYVESVLRYGLPADFCCATIMPKPKFESKTLLKLDKNYANLGRQFAEVQSSAEDEVIGAIPEDEYKPYVWFEIRWGADSR